MTKTTPADVHAAADDSGVAWDDNPAFMAWCQRLVGKRHLDDMTESQLRKVVLALRARKMTKVSQLKSQVKLQPHQAQAREHARAMPEGSGLVLNWGLGSGKTIGALALAEDKGGNVLVVTPASLRENFRQQLRQHVSPLRHGAYTVVSYDEFRRDPGSWVSRVRPTTLIADEFHRLRNPRPREPFDKIRGRVKFMVGLTGSLVNNRPEEMVPLVNLVAGRQLYSQEEFRRRHLAQKKVTPGFFGRLIGVKPGVEEKPKNLPELGRRVGQFVHRFTGDEAVSRHMPDVSERRVEVEMSPGQESMYRALSTRNPLIAYKLRHNLPPSKRDLKDMNAFLSAARQISNNPGIYTVKRTPSPKFQAMIEDIKTQARRDKNFKAVIYSNFLDSGVVPLVEELNRSRIPAATFTGGLNDAQRRRLISDFNAGRLRVLGLSPAGGEGLDLKGVKLVQLTEEHWNPERTAQAVGRSVRFKSHSHLPADERVVDVRRYLSVHRPTLVNRLLGTKRPLSADEWIDERRREKQELNRKFLGALPEYSD